MKPVLAGLCALPLTIVGWYAGRAARPDAAPAQTAPVLAQTRTAAPSLSPAAPWTDTTLAVSERIERLFAAGQKISSSTETYLRSFELAAQLRDGEFPGAIAAARESSVGDGIGIARMISSYWAERDLPSAVAWLKSLPLAQQAEFAGHIGGTWGRMDADGLLGWLESLPEEARRRVAAPNVSSFVASAGAQQPERVARLLAHFPPSRAGDEFAQLFASWASLAPVTAAQRALELPPGAARSSAVESVAREWARRDPAAARAWLDALKDAALATRARPAFALGLAENDPRAAAEFAGEMLGTPWSGGVIAQLARRWAERDPDAALRWSDSLADAGKSRAAANAIIDALATRDPARAAELFAARPAEGPVDVSAFFSGQQALPNIARGLLAKGGIAAVDGFAQKLPEELRQSAMSFALMQWGWSEPDALAAWAVKQPENENRALGLGLVVQQMGQRDPQRAASWAESLPPGASRDAALSTAAMQWLLQDSAAARAWIGKTPLFPSEMREQLLKIEIPNFTR